VVTSAPSSEPVKAGRSARTVELTPREISLLLKYGYPFPEQEATLRKSRAVAGYHHVRIDAYWIELMIGGLVRSAKKLHSRALLEELDELCCALEAALDDRPRLTDFE
jgi:hypothetical protein